MGTPEKTPNHPLAQASIEARAQIVQRIEQADCFVPVAVERFQVVKHRGKGFWVEFDGFQMATSSAGDALSLIDGIKAGLFSTAYLSSRTTVRHQERSLVDISLSHGLAGDMDTFRSILASNDLKAVYHGSYTLSQNTSQLAAMVIQT